MNVFVIGWSTRLAPDPRRAEGAVAGTVRALPFMPGVEVRTWHAPSGGAVAAWAAGSDEYAGVEDSRLVLWAGRPLRWEGDRAEGRAPLDASFYRAPAHRWAGGVDGRCTVVRYDDAERGLQAFVDSLGAYPVYRVEAGGVVWLSNRAEPLRALTGSRAVSLDALAGLLGAGWPLGGRPLWSAVERVAPGAVLSLHPEAGERRRELLPAATTAALCGTGLDANAAADALTESVRGLADWPGRPSIVPVTGGRDSRLVLAAALRAGFDFAGATGGAPDSPDVEVGRALCQAAGIEHHIVPADPHGDVFSVPAEAARVLGLSTSGTASLADAAGFPMGPREGPPVLWHSGQGGEIARAYYRAAAGRDRDAIVGGLERVLCGRRPGRAEPLSDGGRARLRAGVAAWADGRLAAGARIEDLPDLFYLDERMGAWAGPSHGAVEWIRDTTSPLWSTRLLPHLLAPRAADREREVFHDAVLRELAPELADVPYAGAAKHGLRHKARRAVQEARRRFARDRGSDPFSGVLSDVREAVAAAPRHVAWEVLDRDRVDRLLAREPAALDEMSRAYVWRLATVFLDPAMAEAEAAP
jgi:hypothetical protein